MQKVILLTEEEYNQIKSESPSSIMKATIDNLKASNDKLTLQVFELTKELQTYKLGGAKPRLEDFRVRYKARYSELVHTYNILSNGKIKDTVAKTARELRRTPKEVKEILKDGITNNVIERLKDNTYIFKD